MVQIEYVILLERLRKNWILFLLSFKSVKPDFHYKLCFLYNISLEIIVSKTKISDLRQNFSYLLPSFSWKASLINSLAVGLSARSTGVRSVAGFRLFSCLSIKTNTSNVNSLIKKNRYYRTVRGIPGVSLVIFLISLITAEQISSFCKKFIWIKQ